MSRRVRLALEVAAVAAVVAATAMIGIATGDFRGLPKGYDAAGHLAYVQILLRNFPHLSWNASWYGGVPMIPGIYGPAYHLVVAATTELSGWSIATSMVAVTIVTYLAASLGCYAFVRLMTGSKVAGLVASAGLLATPIFWAQSLALGEYARLLAVALTCVAMAAVAAYGRRPSRWRLALVVVVTAASLLSHQEAGALCLLLVVALLVVVVPGRLDDRLRRAGLVALVTAGVVAGFYLPLVLSPHPNYLQDPGSPFTPVHNAAVGARAVFGLGAAPFSGLAPALAGIAVLLSVLALLGEARRRPHRSLAREHVVLARGTPGGTTTGLLVALWIVPLVVLAYSLVNLIPSVALNLASFKPKNLLLIAAVPLTCVVAVAAVAVARDLRGRLRLGLGVVALAGAGALIVALLPQLRPVDDSFSPPVPALEALLPTGASGTQQLRVGAVNDAVTEWLNIDTATPQVRGYIEQQIPHHDWQFWLETALASPSTPAAVRTFLLQWYGVRWLYAGPGATAIQPYRAEPQRYLPLGTTAQGGGYQVFRYRQATPVVVASAAPAVLVCSPDRATYDHVLRDLAAAGAGPNSVVPVEGPGALEQLDLATMRRFAAIIFYGPLTDQAPTETAARLRSYVRDGGHLYVSAASNVATMEALAQAGAPVLGSPATPDAISDGWQFTTVPGIDPFIKSALTRFAPPAPGKASWGIDAATQLTPGAAVQVWSQGLPVLVTGSLGRGSMTFDGLNLIYHAAVTKQPAEADLLVHLLHLDSVTAPATLSASVPPTGAITVVAGARSTGVLVKENLYPQWSATVDGRPSPIFPAGPGMMYVPLAPDAHAATEAVTVTLAYQLSPLQWLGLGISVACLAGVLLYAIGLPTERQRRWLVRRAQCRDLRV